MKEPALKRPNTRILYLKNEWDFIQKFALAKGRHKIDTIPQHIHNTDNPEFIILV